MLIPVVVKNGLAKSEDSLEDIRFADLDLKECHLEEFIRKNVTILVQDEDDEDGDGETVLVVGQQLVNSEGGRSDLVAIDGEGSLLLIELKRDQEDAQARREPVEFQAVRYAASLATIETPDDLVNKVFARYVEKHRNEFAIGELTPTEMARRKLDDFLKKNGAEATFNRKQRVLLIASSFDPQTLSAVAWLIKNGVDIAVFELNAKRVGDKVYLDLLRVLPPKPLSSFYVSFDDRPSGGGGGSGGEGRRRLPRIPELMNWGIIKQGDALEIKNHANSDAVVVNDKTVEFRAQEMSYNDWGQSVTGWSAICIYEWAKLKGSDKTLDDLRKERIENVRADELLGEHRGEG